VQKLAASLAPIKESATESLKVINDLANNMEHEKIKFEGIEHRFKSVAENSRKTVVSSLRRESSTELSLPQSANDAKKFKERFETMMNRFGEVSGSHNRVITAFMKKHANKMRGEFDDLSKLLNQTKTIMSDFEQQRAPIVKCNGILNTASQKASSIRSTEASVRSTEQEIERIENELNGLKSELGTLRASPEFERAAAIMQKANKAEMQKEQLHSQLTDLFSHASRAFTKYSYGLTKETEARLQMMTDEPWRMLYESDISSYSSILIEIHKSISSGNIQLKDSDKILSYLDDILKSLPEFRSRVQALKAEADLLRQSDSGLVVTAKELEERVLQHEEELAKNRQNLEQQRRQIAEKNSEVSALLKEVGDILADLTGKKYLLEY
jgi:DNA repair exonuclease SbcCD ATPase subunit